MLIRRFAFTALLLSSSALPLAAQSVTAECAAVSVLLRDACQKGTDIFSMLAPQVQGAIAGGGPVLGSARTVYGMSIGVRVNAVDGRVPDLSAVTLSRTGAVRSAMPTKRAPVPAPALDVAFGLFPGIPLGLQRVLSLEGLVNVSYIPNRSIEDFSVKATNGSLKLGYGGRVGVLADRMLVPAVSVSYFRRPLPTATFSSSFASGIGGLATRDSLALQNLSVQNEAYRIAISKKLGFIELGGGVGQDRYRTSTSLRAVLVALSGPSVAQSFALSQTLKRNAAYGSFAINISKLRIGAEAGATFTGKDSVFTYNSFTEGKVNERRLFGSAGVRVSF
jgi:hypothetical protein